MLEFLSGWATVEELQPGRVRVAFSAADGEQRTITLVMTPDEWDDIVTIPNGDFDLAAEQLREWIFEAPVDHDYLVTNNQYGLQPSKLDTLPARDDDSHVIPGGEWYADVRGEPRRLRDRVEPPDEG